MQIIEAEKKGAGASQGLGTSTRRTACPMALWQVGTIREGQWRSWGGGGVGRGITRSGWSSREEGPDCACGPSWKALAGVQAGDGV